MTGSTRQIIDSALQDNPLAIKSAIETVIGEKIAAALEAKKITVAQNLIGIGECSDFGGKHAGGGKPAYHTKFSNGASKFNKEDIDMVEFKAFLSDELEMELDDEDVEFLLEDMDDETMAAVLLDYKTLTEAKKKVV